MTLIYQINRSKRRRNLAIKVAKGKLEIQAPWHMPEATIRAFVNDKHAWIDKHLQRQRRQLDALAPRLWESGERLRWLGEPMTLKVATATRKSVERYGAELFVTKTARSQAVKEPRLTIISWYKRQAEAWLDDFFATWPEHHGLTPSTWSIGDFTSKWGHCTRKQALKFTWKLWIAPPWVVRNVVIHELCHLKEFNHSKAFWRLVQQYSPDYQAAEAWLRQHGVTVLNADYLDYCDENSD
ncbi:SprT family zinc-dependent metalloprotease [Pseudidiomarina gelatinasegens]|uniref:M48 family metallopeptidase n=1 Tax=Pseudidiomarina gelatinasegens TaxID=2487740 RepID=UPI0030EB387F|tara:strand:- start:1926 stop:2645 length:720 start_codon:yes stop_codon:yes gene_type:complete